MNGRFLTSVIWTILTLFIVVGLAFLWAVIFSIVLILLFNILVSVFNKQSAAEGEFALVAAGMFLGILSTPLSLLPSYKLSLKLAEWIEKKWGVAVDNPKKLFWLSLLIPIGVLILLSLISPS